MEQIINGKKVVWRDSLPARQGWIVMQKFGAIQAAMVTGEDGESTLDMTKLAFDDTALLIAGLVKEWEFDGDPGDPKTLAELNLFTEYLPLMNATGEAINELIPTAEPEKN